MERRDFLKTTCGLCIGVFTSSLVGSSCTTNKYVTNHKLEGNKLIVPKTEFTSVVKGKNKDRKFLIVKPDNSQFPIAVYKSTNSGYQALLLQCTHQGCELSAYETTMVCPCHGAEFNTEGKVTQGPAEINLKQFTVTHDNENIYISLR